MSTCPSNWIPWFGGESPLPAGVPFEFRFRDGELSTQVYTDAPDWRWSHTGAIGDIIAYRIVKNAELTKGQEPVVIDEPDYHAAPVTSLSVKVCEMCESNGRVTWVVYLAKSPTAYPWDCHQVYSDTIEGRARYKAAALSHFLGLGPQPDILAFDTDQQDIPADSVAKDAALELARDALERAKVYQQLPEHHVALLETEAAIAAIDAAMQGEKK